MTVVTSSPTQDVAGGRPSPVPGEARPRRRLTRTAYRFRLTVICLTLVTLAFVQDPGRIAADTKLDLTLDPWRFLGRALHLWDPLGFFGQVQNQAYGYLFPIGPFFAAGEALGLPGWVVQRLWWSVVLITGFLGVVRLARHLGITRPLPRILAGLAFALGARSVTTLGPISSETWVAALVPWALVPLVSTAPIGLRARGLRAAVPVLLAGAVNAVATASLLVLPGLWLLTRRWDRRLLVLGAWWALGVALACAWWVVPLLLLGSVSPPFLDWIESSAVTTRFTDLGSVLRGTTSWVAYITDPSGPVWYAGWQLVTSGAMVVGLTALAGMGLAGLTLWRERDAWFLRLGLLAGLFLVGVGHVGAVSGLGAAWLRDLLDGPLAPLRNTHKFQPLVTLVLVLGLARLLEHVLAARSARRSTHPETSLSRGRGSDRARLPAPLTGGVGAGLAIGMVAAALMVAATPAWTGTLTRDRSYLAVPSYWGDTAQWLAEHGGRGRALVVPGAPFGDYLWGRSQDEPLQGLAVTPWAVRDAVPLSSAGNIRLLDEVEARIAAGQGSTGLAQALARSGLRYVVVRNDLDTTATQAPRRALVRKALRQSPGLTSVVTFGPQIQGFQSGEIVSAESQELPYAAVEIWQVESLSDADRALAEGGVAVRPLSRATQLQGGPEALPALGDAGLLADGPTFLPGDLPAGSQSLPLTATDTPRRTEVAFGLSRDNRSTTMTADQPYESQRLVHDYVIDGSELPLGTDTSAPAIWATASSARSEINAPRAIDPGSFPRAAVDGDLATAWRTPLGRSTGEWLRLELGRSVDPGSGVQAAFVADGTLGALPRTVRVTTEAGSSDSQVSATDDLQALAAPTGATSWVRIELLATATDRRAVSFGVREVRVPGIDAPDGSTVAPEVAVASPGAAPAAVVLSTRLGERGACVLAGLADPCDPTLARQGEERGALRRIVDVPADAHVQVRVRPRPGDALDRLVDPPADEGITVTATSSAVPDAPGRPGAVVDRDLGTTWVAGANDREPTLTLHLPEEREISGLLFVTSPGAPASSPFQLTVTMNGRSTQLFTQPDGRVRLPEMPTREVGITFGFTSPRRGYDLVAGELSPYPVGVGEIVVVGADDLRRATQPEAEITLPCGQGPSVRIGDQVVPTSVRTTAGAVLDGQVITARTCAHDELRPGSQVRVLATATETFLVDQVSLVDPEAWAAAARDSTQPGGQPTVERWDPSRRVLQLPASSTDTVMELGENANVGWRATVGGVALEPVRVDGWRQGWVVPAGTSGEVVLDFAPDQSYRRALLVGGVLALALVVAAALPRRWLRGGALTPALGPARPGVAVRGSILGAGMLLVAGPVGLVGALAVLLARPSRRARVAGILGAVAVVAILSAAWTWPQLPPAPVAWVAGAAAVTSIVLACVPGRPGRLQPTARSRAGDPRQPPNDRTCPPFGELWAEVPKDR